MNRDSEEADAESDPVAKLQRELDRTREEKDTLAAQYRNLLAKLTTMRTTLGNKLKQDAVRIIFYYVPYTAVNILLLRRKNLTGGNNWCSS